MPGAKEFIITFGMVVLALIIIRKVPEVQHFIENA